MATPLNAAQHEAVEHADGPLLVLAGAGSGKTRVIIHRIARLIERGVPPQAILAVTFTNRAAGEMGERLGRLVGTETAARVWMSTFHSFGVRFVTEEKAALGHGGRFVIFDQADSLGLVRDLIRRERGADRRLDAAAILQRISLWKNRFVYPEQVPASDFEYDAVARELYPLYEAALRNMRAVDFDDLVIVPVRILGEDPNVRLKWQRRFRHVLVDEFQDTNRSQLELVRLLAGDHHNVCVVGDDDQSIYGWRGAEVGNILDFEDHFPGTRVVKLEENYRSRSEILDVANEVIGQSQGKRHRKVLRSQRGQGRRVHVCVTADAEAEAKVTVREMRRLSSEERVPWGEMAVLYRSNTQSRPIEEELRVGGVPYKMYGGTQFFDRKEVKDAIAYLRVVVNPRDELSLRRILNHPPRGIGDTTVERIARHAQARGMPFPRAVVQLDRIEGVPEAARRGGEALGQALERARSRFRGGARLTDAARDLLDDVGLRAHLTDAREGPQGARRWENVEALLRSIARYEASADENKPTITQFLTRLTLRFDQEREEVGDRVTLSTLHAAKGLEFGTVFLIGCIEGQLPHTRTTDPKVTEAAPTDVDEERRLFYVGVTRARDRLYLTRPERRTRRGREMKLAPSRFLEGLPAESIEEQRLEAEPPMENEEVADMAQALLDQLSGR